MVTPEALPDETWYSSVTPFIKSLFAAALLWLMFGVVVCPGIIILTVDQAHDGV